MASETKALESKAWGGRFSAATHELVEAFTASIHVDQRLGTHDVRASIAHAEMLESVGLISPSESKLLVTELTAIGERLATGTLPLETKLEDVHMHVEAALIAALGDVGRKLHTARSRNDQVATSLRLWTRDAIDRTVKAIDRLQGALVAAAAEQGEVVMPGYTHLQRAQPILAGHAFLAHAERFERDRQRLFDARGRVNVLPLGSAALAGTSLPIDRELVREKLGFAALTQNSLDATSDRDFVAETLFALALTATHLSSLAEEWILYATTEFGFIELPDALCTGSSIMPQKKNPDALELVRGKTGRVVGALQGALVLLKGLPLAYNRDLQEDKPALFDAFDTVLSCLGVTTLVASGMKLKKERIAATLDAGYLDATSAMEALIRAGMPMRSAHEVLGRLVKEAESRGLALDELEPETLAAVHPLLPGIRAHFGVENSVKAMTSEGSTGFSAFRKSLARWQDLLAGRT